MDVHHNLPKKPTSFSSDFFALALSICLCFYFCNICIHVGIYCCLMSHTSMITSEISHRFWESPANEVIHSFLFFFFLYSLFFSVLRLSIAFFFFFFLTHKIPGVFFNIVPALWPTGLRLARGKAAFTPKKDFLCYERRFGPHVNKLVDFWV